MAKQSQVPLAAVIKPLATLPPDEVKGHIWMLFIALKMIAKEPVGNGMSFLFTGSHHHISWIMEKVVPSAVIAVRPICARTCSLLKVAVVSSVASAAVSPRVSHAPGTCLSCWIHPNQHLMLLFVFSFHSSSASPLLPASGSHREEGGLLRPARALNGQLWVYGYCGLL